MPGIHSPLAPSGAHLWAPREGCRGSVDMQAQYPEDDDTPEAREGVAAHWYVAELLNGRDVTVGALADNGEPITAEMVDCAQALLIDVRDTMKSCASPVLCVEQTLVMPSIHPEAFGTPDVLVIDMPQKRIHLWDYKYGHRFVDAIGNWQMMAYAIGAFDFLGFDSALALPAEKSWAGWVATVTIAQPRNYHRVGPMREWRIAGDRLREEWLPQFRVAAVQARSPGAMLKSNPDCRDCSGRYACPALQQAAAYAIDVSTFNQPVDLTPHAAGLELRQINDAIRRLEARKTGLEELALGMVRRGERVPFFTAQHSVGRERWKEDIPADEVFALGDMFGVEMRKPQEPITPNQARNKGIDADVIKAYAEQPRGAVRLEPADDTAAKLAFE